jgi:hypothetical protein
MKPTFLLAALFALLVPATPAFAQASAQSSSQDRQRFVAIVRNLERTPFDRGVQADRRWALQWLTDAPDVSVTVCAGPLGNVVSEKGYKHSADIVVQYVLAMGAFIIENPGKADDLDAQQLAGVESALKTYRSMRAAKPDEQSPILDKLLVLQDKGELPGFVREAFRKCQASSGG